MMKLLRPKEPLAESGRREPDPGSPRKVIFVCSANICRSPVAEAIFNSLAAERDLPYRAESVGTSARRGVPMADNAAAALRELGFSAGDHVSSPLDEEALRSASLILAMTPRHAERLRNSPVDLEDRLRLLTHYAGQSNEQEITDPYGHTMAVYRASVNQILLYVEALVQRLASEARSPNA